MIISSRSRKVISRTSLRKFLKYTQRRYRSNECEDKDCCGRPIHKPDPTNYIIEKICKRCNYFDEWKPKVPRLDNCISNRLKKVDNKPKKCTADLNNTNKRKTTCDIKKETAVCSKKNEPKTAASYKPPPPPKCRSPNMNCVGGPKEKKKCIQPIPAPDWDPDGTLQ